MKPISRWAETISERLPSEQPAVSKHRITAAVLLMMLNSSWMLRRVESLTTTEIPEERAAGSAVL
jgi:hypothetical protein